MRLQAPTSPTSPLLWFAVGGAPAAWVVQFAIGYWIAQAQCSPTGNEWGIPIATWAIVITVIAGLVAIAAGTTALGIYSAAEAEEDDDPPPSGRTRFLAIVGMAITPLFFAIIVMNGVGAATFHQCTQS